MDRFTVFDQLLDAVFVVSETTEIAYVNRVAADLCGVSQKRLIGKKKLSELFSFNSFEFPFNENSLGFKEPGPYLETIYTSLTDKGKSGRVQMAVAPWFSEEESAEKLWYFVMHDVSLEEVLHGKYRSELEAKEGYIKDLEVARAELEKYSKNLEEIVAQRTQELSLANRTLQAVIDSLGQGFFTFDKDGKCGNLFTKACNDLLQTEPAGKLIDKVLKVDEGAKSEFKMWVDSLFSEPLPFEDLRSLGPDWFKGDVNRSVFLEYFPIREESGAISDVVVVATDKTFEIEAQKKLEEEKSFVDMILKFVRGQSPFIRFLKSVPDVFARLDVLIDQAAQHEEECFRLLHTLEGEAGTFSLQKLRMSSRVPQQILQVKEDRWEEDFKNSIQSLKDAYTESVNTIESFFGKVMSSNSDHISLSFEEIDDLASRIDKIESGKDVANELRSLKFQEKIGSAFNHYDGLVRTVAEKLGKRVRPIQFIGGDLKVDLRPLRPLVSSFVHLFRNIVDHGIEESEERQIVGKSAEGNISVLFEMKNNTLVIKASDDGRGISPSMIRKKLTAKFQDEDFSGISDEDVIQEILRPNFSSREQVGEFSGRGVGMDAVREEVANLGGTMRVLSKEGEGTSFIIEVPLTSSPKNEVHGELKRSA